VHQILEEYFLRGLNSGANNDPDALVRWSLVPGIIGDILGTFELDEIYNHAHPPLDGVGYQMKNHPLPFDDDTQVPQVEYLLQQVSQVVSESRPINAKRKFCN